MFDAIICGGGPAGAAAGAELARGGREVLLVEKDIFPRFHIGESLLPLSNPIIDRLGLGSEMESMGFVLKRGATFLSECNTRAARVEFEGAPGIKQPETYHVPRANFDDMLLRNAATQGADVRTGSDVVDIDVDREFPRVTVKSEQGEEFEAEGRFLLDATGRAGLLARRLGLREMDGALRKAALYAHFEGISHPEGRAAGDIRVIVRPGGGWVWLIPLPEGKTSVGFVFDSTEITKELNESPEECLERWMLELPLFCEEGESIKRIGPARWESDFSYSTKTYSGENWLLAGDSGSFLDPVFSSGVQLALAGGVDAGVTIERALTSSPAERRRALQAFNREQRRKYMFYRRLVLSFYKPAFQDLLFSPESWPAGARALAAALAGDDSPGLATRIRLEVLFLISRLRSWRGATA